MSKNTCEAQKFFALCGRLAAWHPILLLSPRSLSGSPKKTFSLLRHAAESIQAFPDCQSGVYACLCPLGKPRSRGLDQGTADPPATGGP